MSASRRLVKVIAGLVTAVALTISVPVSAYAAPPAPSAGEDFTSFAGSRLRLELAELGVYRPMILNFTLGLVAVDICYKNDVRPELEDILVFPDFQIANFFLAAHRVC
jgi:hypothetical protein